MPPCLHCGAAYRSLHRTCLHCGRENKTSAWQRQRFNRLQLAIQVSDLRGAEADHFRAVTLPLLQRHSLTEIAERVTEIDDGRFARCAAVLRNLSAGEKLPSVRR